MGDNGMANLSDAPSIFLDVGCLTYGEYRGLRGVDPANSGDLDGSPGFGTHVVQCCGVGGGVSIAGVVGSAGCCTGLNVSKKRFSSVSNNGSGVAGSENNFIVGSFLGVWVFVRFPGMLSMEKLAIVSLARSS